MRLFRVAGIDVFIHWSWLVVAILRVDFRMAAHSGSEHLQYTAPIWYAFEYLALFAIVLMHEFGHALACRQVGGTANRIILWPLGGIAFVNPPPRPGAFLWSIAAGPLVNLVLVPVMAAFWILSGAGFPGQPMTNLQLFITILAIMNLSLLIFNLLPLFPLDGGQIFQALLWFLIGRAQSLMVVTIIGLVFGLGITLVAVVGAVTVAPGFWWLAIMFGFAALASLGGFAHARLLMQKLDAPRRRGLACPSCGSPPPVGESWACDRCRTRFDTFAHQAQCPGCGKRFGVTMCVDCLARHPFPAWFANAAREATNRPLDVIPADIVVADHEQPLDVIPVEPVNLSPREAQPQDRPPPPPAAPSESGEHQSP